MANFVDRDGSEITATDKDGSSLSFNERDAVDGLTWRNEQTWRNFFTWRGGGGGFLNNFEDKEE